MHKLRQKSHVWRKEFQSLQGKKNTFIKTSPNLFFMLSRKRNELSIKKFKLKNFFFLVLFFKILINKIRVKNIVKI